MQVPINVHEEWSTALSARLFIEMNKQLGKWVGNCEKAAFPKLARHFLHYLSKIYTSYERIDRIYTSADSICKIGSYRLAYDQLKAMNHSSSKLTNANENGWNL
jgi:hypothetical protein